MYVPNLHRLAIDMLLAVEQPLPYEATLYGPCEIVSTSVPDM